MTNKKKKGLGFIISGAAFIVVGAFVFKSSLPALLPQIFVAIGLVLKTFGITFVYPDENSNG